MKMLMFVGLAIGSLLACAANVDDGVGEIHQELKRIRSHLSDMESTERILLGISAEGASVIAYRENGAIRKIAVEALGETGKYLADFYFKDRRFFFSHVRIIDYGGNIMEALEDKELRKDVVEEDRFFFADDKLIRWLKFEKQILPSDPRYQEKGQAILAEAWSFVLLMETSLPKEGEDYCDWICDQERDGHCVKYKCE